jgi:hypothetical protein
MHSESASRLRALTRSVGLAAVLLATVTAAQAEPVRWELWADGSGDLTIAAPVYPQLRGGPSGLAFEINRPRGERLGQAGGLADAPSGRLSTEAGPGINFNWFDLDENCDPGEFSVLSKLHRPGVRERVLQQLIEQRARGAESIAIGIFHFRAPGTTIEGVWDNGTLLDSTGGNLHPRIRQNLADLLSDIRDAGFAQLLLRFHPQGINDPARWSSFDAEVFEENWNLIANVVPIAAASGLDWRVDLMTEGMPRARFARVLGQLLLFPTEPDNEAWSRYANRLWQNYVSVFGPERSVGISSISDSDPDRLRARIEHTSYVYRMNGGERIYPGALAFDIYGRDGVDEGELYRRIVDRLQRIGLGDMPLIIAETFYNDREALGLLSAAMRETGTRPLFLLHWPVDRRFQACSTDVNVREPFAIDQLLRFGF